MFAVGCVKRRAYRHVCGDCGGACDYVASLRAREGELSILRGDISVRVGNLRCARDCDAFGNFDDVTFKRIELSAGKIGAGAVCIALRVVEAFAICESDCAGVSRVDEVVLVRPAEIYRARD